MSERHALIIGIDSHDGTTSTYGAVADALDLARALVERGTDPANIQVLLEPVAAATGLPPEVAVGRATAPAIRQGVGALARALGSDDDTALVHFGAPGRLIDGAPGLATADTDAAITWLLEPLSDRPIRSVLISLDAAFGEDSQAMVGSGDPVLLPIPGQPRERMIDGAPRGLLSWALARAVRAMPEDPNLTFADLHHVVHNAMRRTTTSSGARLSPPAKAELPLGSFAEPGPAHVPWRGIAAAWQFGNETGTMVAPANGQFIVGAGSPSRELWVWNSQPWPQSGFQVQVVNLNPQPVQTPYNFSNNGFSGPVPSNPPQIGQGDRIFRVDVPGANGALVYLIARNVQQPTAMEWYTTSTDQYLPVSIGDTLNFVHQTSLPQHWSSHTWYRALETP